MSPYVFIERSRFGKSFYELRGDHLTVSGKRGFQKYRIEVELSDASPQIERLSRRFYRPIVIPLALGISMSALTAGLMMQRVFPFEAVHHFVQITGFSAAGFLGGGLRWIPRVQVVRFTDLRGQFLFDVIKEKGYADEFEAFIEYLRETITQSKMPNQPSQPTLSNGPRG